MAQSRRWIYFFGGGKADGDGTQRDLLGGKGAGLAEMTRIGLPVPAGFTITTEACAAFHQSSSKWPTGLEQETRRMLKKLEQVCKKRLGDAKDPLLVSVRSGAARSMPGMMETILNLGLNDQSVEGLAQRSGDRRFAFDAYRRFIMMHGSTARGISRELFDDAFDQMKESRTRCRLLKGPGERVVDTDVNADELEELVAQFKRIYQDDCGDAFPQDPFDQLKDAINAVFRSWMGDKARTYRRVEHITGLAGTAVNVCQMVFGNMGDDSGTGVCFTRDPSTGESLFYGDLLINAQGEDVVSGVRTPIHLEKLAELMPEVYEQLQAARVMLELHYKDMQDVEFTIERDKLYILQCRSGKRSPGAAFRIAVEQATKGLLTASEVKRLVKKKFLPKKYASAASKPIITKDEAIQRIVAEDIQRLFYPVITTDVSEADLAARRIGEGIGAVPGAASGEVAFSADRAEQRAADGATVVLVRKETSPEDVGGMHVSAGILTAMGGKTSHAAVVARGWGKCCIVGCDDLSVDYANKTMRFGDRIVREGEFITLDGTSGTVYEGRIDLERPPSPKEFDTLMGWCDQKRRMRVRANADTPQDAAKAVEFGAEGIGLCRTEHMFFDPQQPQRIRAMREMIMADGEASRRRALDKLLPYQRQDFEGVFEAMDGKPVTIRLLDPPLHEFLPHDDNPEAQQALVDDLNAGGADVARTVSDAGGSFAGAAPGADDRTSGGGNVSSDQSQFAAIPQESAVAVMEHELTAAVLPADKKRSGAITVQDVRRRVEQLAESNPMLGHRGCRLCITYPEILEMQVRAIMEAAVACQDRGIKVLPEIMIPLSIDAKELRMLSDQVRETADAVLMESNVKVKYLVGTMIETPRAALTAGAMAEVAEFFSFGTNDLTQMTMGLSRDDAGRFLPDYVDADKANIFPDDPFQSIDADGVGRLVRMAAEDGRHANKSLKLGICGEHGGDPASIALCEEVNLDYVSCSPFRVPIARLAAAQAMIQPASADRKTSGGRKVPSRSTAKPRAAAKRTKASARTTAKRSKAAAGGARKITQSTAGKRKSTGARKNTAPRSRSAARGTGTKRASKKRR